MGRSDIAKEIIDPVETCHLRAGFNDIFREAQRGKALESFKFLDKYLLALDGTQYFCSENIHCKNCLIKEHKNGKRTYSHQILGASLVHPLMKQVIPMVPEPIQKLDGQTKNDCERNAANRFLEKLRKDHPKLPFIITEDGLSSNGPHIKKILSLNMSYILGAKPGDHKYLFDWINSLDSLEEQTRTLYKGNKVIRRIVQEIRFTNEVPLNDTNHDLLVNFLELIERVEKKVEKVTHDKDGLATLEYEWVEEKVTKFSWVTDIKITKGNVFTIMEGGRKRWAIENETFNTLKNQGYNFEHNYGHGNENLATNFAFLMMLAFLVDQVQELCCKTFQKVLEKVKTKKSFWNEILSFFKRVRIKTDWHGLFMAILNPPDIELNTG